MEMTTINILLSLAIVYMLTLRLTNRISVTKFLKYNIFLTLLIIFINLIF